MNKKELLKGNTETIILAALADGPKHGYRITQWVNHESNNMFSFKAGMLYPLLHHMEKAKYIRADWEDSQSGAPKRKVYCITSKGKKILVQKTQEWKTFASLINKLIA